MKKNSCIWLIIIIYQLSACVGFSFACCCSHESCDLPDKASDHVHSHSRMHLAAHLLLHLNGLDENAPTGIHSRHCDSPFANNADQSVCAVVSQPILSRLIPRNQLDAQTFLVDQKPPTLIKCVILSNHFHVPDPSKGRDRCVVLLI